MLCGPPGQTIIKRRRPHKKWCKASSNINYQFLIDLSVLEFSSGISQADGQNDHEQITGRDLVEPDILRIILDYDKEHDQGQEACQDHLEDNQSFPLALVTVLPVQKPCKHRGEDTQKPQDNAVIPGPD